MKVAILSESPADELAIRTLAEAVLGETLDLASTRTRPGGIDAALRVVAPTLKACHYGGLADGLIVAVDADNTVVHRADHASEASCRWCRLHDELSATVRTLRPVAGRKPVQLAVAVPPPSMEAWLRFGVDNQCTEAGWLQRQSQGVNARSEIRILKRQLYGSERATLSQIIVATERELTRLASSIESLEQHFPNSFGAFADALRSWTVAK